MNEVLIILGSGLTTFIGYFLNQHLDRQKNEKEEIRKNKIPVYEQIVKFFFEVLMHEKVHGKQMNNKKTLQFFIDITPRLVAWGGDDVVKAFAEFRTSSFVETDDEYLILKNFQKVLLAIRNELGHSSVDMDEALVKLYLNDDPSVILGDSKSANQK